MQKQKKTSCDGCASSKECQTTSATNTQECSGESWRCLLKKWHLLTAIAIIYGFGAKIPDRIIDAAFPAEKDNLEETPSIQKGYKIVRTLEHLPDGREIVIIEPDKPADPAQPPKEKTSSPQFISIKPVLTPPLLPQRVKE